MTDDPVVMYIVVRESLAMSPGKLAAQVGHAVMMHMHEYAPDKHRALSDEEFRRHALTREWLDSKYRKIVLGASDAEFLKVQLENDRESYFLVVDAGFTEVEPNTETVIGFWPMRKSERTKTLKRLRLL